MPVIDNTVRNISEAAVYRDKGEKLKHSVFLITINSNKRKYTEEYLNEFKDVMSALLQDDGEGIMPYIEPSKRVDDPDYLDKIEGITVDSRIENLTDDGKEITKLHTHSVVNITHRTWININYNRLKDDIKSVLKGAYVHVKNVPRDIDTVEEYVRKYDILSEKAGSDLPKITIDPSAPSFHDFLNSRGITPSNAKSNFHSKMDKKSILGQILARPELDKRATIIKIAKKLGLDTEDYEDALIKVYKSDSTITDEELEQF